MNMWWLFLFVPLSYLMGSISFGFLISKFKLKKDVRTCGSGGTGATNMLRTFGAKWAWLVFFLDIFKGTLATLMGLFVFGGFSYSFNPMVAFTDTAGQIGMYACGLASIVGHCFPVWTGFRGGKGTATAMGVLFVINPAIAFAGFVLAFAYGIPFGHASVASIMFITLVVLWESLVRSPGIAVSVILVGYYVLILFTHRANIKRILTEREPRTALFKKKKKVT